MHYKAISNTVSHFADLQSERINTTKQKDGLTFMLNVLEAEIVQICISGRTYICSK